jgi:hypothetical protein
MGGYMDSKAGLNAMEKKKSTSYRKSNPDRQAPQPVALPTELFQLSSYVRE